MIRTIKYKKPKPINLFGNLFKIKTSHDWKRIPRSKVPRWAKSKLRNSVNSGSSLEISNYNLRAKIKGKKYKYMLKTHPTYNGKHDEDFYRRKK